MQHNFYIYLLIMAITVYIIRMFPLALLQKPVQNCFIQSLLYYIPYVTLAVMTFPAILSATQIHASGVAALIVGIILSWLGAGLLPVSLSCCLIVFLIEAILL